MPAVSIIIPVYNRLRVVGRALASVFAQEVDDWELIVVDDGSADGSADYLAGLAAAEPRLHLIRHPLNRGAPAARNTGLRAATGDYVAFLDSDDEWLPGKLAAQLAAFAAAPAGLGALATGFVLHRVASGSRIERRPAPDTDWRAELLDGCFVSPGSTLMARRACFGTVGPFAEDLPRFEDWDWLLRLLEHHGFDSLPVTGALVHLEGFAAPEKVRAAARLLWQRQGRTVRDRLGSAAARRLRASLELECAVAALRTGQRAAAIPHVLAATLRSPARVGRLLGRGWHRLRQRDL
jgi:glycosyltransferase involved in cell wall biosynthesis